MFLAAQTGDDMIYIAEASSEEDVGFAAARMQFRWSLPATAGGQALLAAHPIAQRDAYLGRHSPDDDDVRAFLAENDAIRRSRIATNIRRAGTRFAIATAAHNQNGDVVASVSLVGQTADMQPRLPVLSEVLLRHVEAWLNRTMNAREAI